MRLPVLDTPPPVKKPTSNPHVDPQRAAIAGDLSRLVRGEVRFGVHDRMLYATDASMYQVEPIGVVIPADAEDARAAVEYCHARSVAMLPRGGGTSLAGQCTGHAVVMDLSPRFRGIGPVEGGADRPSVVAEAGVPIDELNAELARRKTGLFFAPDPATTAQSCLGGNIGNNAAGSRSVMYGRTSENLLGIDALTARGERLWFGASAGTAAVPAEPRVRELSRAVAAVVDAHAELVRARFPKTLRQNAGYGLDRLLKQLDSGTKPEELDLAQLLCGSEGTLALTLGARLLLRPVPKAKGLLLLAFASVDDAIGAVTPLLGTGPSAVELVDNVVIEAARNNRECSPFVDAFPRLPGRAQDPEAVLYVEYHCASADELADRLAAGEAAGRSVDTAAARRVTDAPGMADAWKLRKAGEPLLHGLPGRRKPLTFIEDNAVPPANLARFVRELRAVVEREGTRAAFWAHASVGVLHVRPMLDPHDPADLERLRRIAVVAADLAKDCGGVMSGEHGDGRVRGPLLRRFFGDELVRAFAEVKAIFDPKGLLNPGNIVGAGELSSITERTRIDPRPPGPVAPSAAPKHPSVETFFSYADQTNFPHAVEMCNGSGLCRKTSGGTMCPSYRATLDERHSTRGRANALRLAITGQLRTDAGGADPAHPWSDPETIETLDLCLSCKACQSECPSNVDVARLKAEFTAQRYKATGRIPLAALATGHVRVLNRVGSALPSLANAVNALPPVRWLIGRLMNLHPRRSLPHFSASLFKLADKPGFLGGIPVPAPDAPRVVLFGDCFTAFNESEIGVAAARALTALGYRVEVADAGCCGRSMISVGMLETAATTIDATLGRLRRFVDDTSVAAVLVVEPSCLSAMTDDWLALKLQTPMDVRARLAGKAMLVEDFIDRRWNDHPRRPSLPVEGTGADAAPILLHAHCHQKALWGADSSARLLRRLFGARVRVLDTGCCGMAGSFGYDRAKFPVSETIAHLPGTGLMPQIQAHPGATVCAPGTSCRHQVRDTTGGTRAALHPVELAARALTPSS